MPHFRGTGCPRDRFVSPSHLPPYALRPNGTSVTRRSDVSKHRFADSYIHHESRPGKRRLYFTAARTFQVGRLRRKRAVRTNDAPAVSRRPAPGGTWPEILRHRGRRSVADRQEAAIPLRRLFASHTRLSAKRSTVWSPSVSFSTSPTSRPNAIFQYVEPGTTISLIMNQ